MACAQGRALRTTSERRSRSCPTEFRIKNVSSDSPPQPGELDRDDGQEMETGNRRQFLALNTWRRERKFVQIYLVSGARLAGRIQSFDASSVLIQGRDGPVLLFHKAISTIGEAVAPRGDRRERRPGAGPGRPTSHSHGPDEDRYPDPVQPPARETERTTPVVSIKRRWTPNRDAE